MGKKHHISQKIVIIGEPTVGKTDLLNKLLGKKCSEYKKTIGADFQFRIFNLENGIVTVTQQIWDISGEERFYDRMPVYFNGTNAIIYVAKINDLNSINALENWKDKLGSKYTNIPSVLVITQYECELSEEEKQERKSLIEETAKKIGVNETYYLSAITETKDIEIIFENLGQKLQVENLKAANDPYAKLAHQVNQLEQHPKINQNVKNAFKELLTTLQQEEANETNQIICDHFTAQAELLVTKANEGLKPNAELVEDFRANLDKKLYGKPPMSKKTKAAIGGIIGALFGFAVGLVIGSVITGGVAGLPFAMIGALAGFNLVTAGALGASAGGLLAGIGGSAFFGAYQDNQFEKVKESKKPSPKAQPKIQNVFVALKAQL